MIVIRNCRGFEELEAVVQLQIDTWGYDHSDIVPRKAFLVMQKVGGQVMGAFDTSLPGAPPEGDANSMVGFVMSLPGVKTGEAHCDKPMAYLHSHMLAVREPYRNTGLGTQLKLEQRLEALSRGIAYMEWTFDPLEIKNAHLNICKLGAIVRGYRENFYGVSSSRLQGGLPTDRLLAEWHLDSDRVRAILAGDPLPKPVITETIVVPASIYQWKASDQDRGKALAIQSENRLKFQQAFSRGMAVLGFRRDAEGNGFYELGPLFQSGTGI